MTARGNLKKQCDEEGIPYNASLPISIKNSRRLVRRFCRKMNVELVHIAVTSENTASNQIKVEPVYFFSDNLGSYTSRGIEESL